MPCPRNAARAAPSQRVLILCTASETLGSRLSYPRSITASTSRALQPSASHAQDAAVDAEPRAPETRSPNPLKYNRALCFRRVFSPSQHTALDSDAARLLSACRTNPRQHGTYHAGLGSLTRRLSTPRVLVLVMHYPRKSPTHAPLIR